MRTARCRVLCLVPRMLAVCCALSLAMIGVACTSDGNDHPHGTPSGGGNGGSGGVHNGGGGEGGIGGAQGSSSTSACSGASGFVISTPLALDKTSVHAGETLTGTATYMNCSAEAISVQEITIAGRPPGGTHDAGPYDDFTPAHAPATVAAGGTITVTASRTFTAADPVGSWLSYVAYRDSSGAWHDGADVPFEVTSSGPGKTYPTGVPFRGINRAGMEYGDDWDGWTGQTYFQIPSAAQTASELAYFKSKGMNVIRVPISWERVQHTLNGPLTPDYVSGMMAYINAATTAGFYVILDLHNYNRYAENVFDASGKQVSGYTQRVLGDGVLKVNNLVDVWVKLANLVQDNDQVILNLMNESHDFPIPADTWFNDINTVISAIRAIPATQLILVPNSRSSDVTHWSTYSPNGGPIDSVAALQIEDSANHYAYDMHAYQDSPSSCASYRDLITEVTTWAKTNHKQLFLTELGVKNGAANGACAINTLLSYMDSNNDVWLGWTPWDLPSYSITSDSHTADAASMAWYTPSLTPNFLGD